MANKAVAKNGNISHMEMLVNHLQKLISATRSIVSIAARYKIVMNTALTVEFLSEAFGILRTVERATTEEMRIKALEKEKEFFRNFKRFVFAEGARVLNTALAAKNSDYTIQTSKEGNDPKKLKVWRDWVISYCKGDVLLGNGNDVPLWQTVSVLEEIFFVRTPIATKTKAAKPKPVTSKQAPKAKSTTKARAKVPA